MTAAEHDPRLPTSLWLDAQLRRCEQAGDNIYMLRKGNATGGTVVLKLRSISNINLYGQQRNERGEMGWVRLMPAVIDAIDESAVDAYIQRAVDRDPDVWVIEIETRRDVFPFDGPVYD